MAIKDLIPVLRNAFERAKEFDTGIVLLERNEISALPIDQTLRDELQRVWGMPYVSGGETIFRGFDCSGFAWWVCEATPKEKGENRDFHRKSSQQFIKWGTKKTVHDYFEKSKNLELYPLVLAIVDKKKDFDHSVVVYGTMMVGDNKYFIIGQAGQCRGIGHDNSSVSVALVREDIFLKKYIDFEVYIPGRARQLARKDEPVAMLK